MTEEQERDEGVTRETMARPLTAQERADAGMPEGATRMSAEDFETAFEPMDNSPTSVSTGRVRMREPTARVWHREPTVNTGEDSHGENFVGVVPDIPPEPMEERAEPMEQDHRMTERVDISSPRRREIHDACGVTAGTLTVNMAHLDSGLYEIKVYFEKNKKKHRAVYETAFHPYDDDNTMFIEFLKRNIMSAYPIVNEDKIDSWKELIENGIRPR